MERHKDFGAWFFIHVGIIFLTYLSPFLIRWQFIVGIVLYMYIQELLLGECIITKIQFGRRSHITFYSHYLKKFGFKLAPKMLDLYLTWLLPLALLCIALLWQEVLLMHPLLF